METGWFFPLGGGSRVNFNPPQKIELVVKRDLDIDHPNDVIIDEPPFQHIPNDLEEK